MSKVVLLLALLAAVLAEGVDIGRRGARVGRVLLAVQPVQPEHGYPGLVLLWQEIPSVKSRG